MSEHHYDDIDFRPNPDPGWRVITFWLNNVTIQMHREEYPLAGWLVQQWSGPGGGKRIVPAFYSPGDECLTALNDEVLCSANEHAYLIREDEDHPVEADARKTIEHQLKLQQHRQERAKANQ